MNITPSRRRSINTGAQLKAKTVAPVIVPALPNEVVDDARKFYLANKRANESAREAEAARARLFKGMKDAGVTNFDLIAALDTGDKVALQAAIKPGPNRTVIDVLKLRKQIKDDPTFYNVISATKAAVEKHCGTAMAELCGEVVAGDENVYVNPKK